MLRVDAYPPAPLSAENGWRLRVTAGALALTVLLVALGLGYAIRESWVRHVAVDEARITAVTGAVSASLQRRLDAINRTLGDLSVAAARTLADGTPAEREALSRRLQELSRASADVNRFGIRDAEGEIIATSDVAMRRAPNASGAEFFEVHRKGLVSELAITRPFAQTNSGIPVVALSRPIVDAHGGFQGVVAATLPVSQLLDGVAVVPNIPTEVALIRDDGVALHRRGSGRLAAPTVSPDMLAARTRASGGTTGGVVTLDGRIGTVAWHGLGSYPVTVIASVAREDLVADFLYRERLSFLVMGTILVIVAGLGAWLAAMMRSHLLRLEAASRSLESRFRDGIESMADGVLLFDAEDRLLAWNRRSVELLPLRQDALRVGLHGREFLACVYRGVYPNRSSAEIVDLVETRLRARRNLEGATLETLDGRVVEVTDRNTSDGGMISLFRDVTDQRRLIEQLSVSEGRFRDFAGTSSDWFWETDAEHRLTYVSHGIHALGIPATSVIGEPFRELGQRSGQRMFCEAQAARLAGRLERRENFRDFELALSAGGAVVELAGKPIYDSTQRFAGYRGGARDVTELRRMHRRVAENEARARDYAEAGSDWMWETDAECRFTFVSDGVRRFGSQPDEFLGRMLGDLPWQVPEDAPGLRALRESMSRRDPFQELVLPATLPLGGVAQIEMTAWPLSDPSGAFTGYRGIGRDVTESMRQRAEVERALIREREVNAQHRRFISIASHEFRTPLAVIDSATQRLEATLGDRLSIETGKRLLRIRSAVSRMAQIIDRTLASARLDEGRIEFRPESFDIAALLRELCERQRSIAPDFIIHCDAPPVLHVTGDPRLIDQIFTNLLSNAVKYSGAARRVDVSIAIDASDYVVEVRDRGVGIDADDLAQLFQRFFRARSAEGIAGTGIGLHLVRELVRMHGGDIEVASRRGEGSTFTVRLPRRAEIVKVEAA